VKKPIAMLSDTAIIAALLSRDEEVTHMFFHVWCRPLLLSLMGKVFPGGADYDELVSELYLHLMEEEGRRLRTFKGRSSLFQWLKCVATRFFIERRDGGAVIEERSHEPLYNETDPSGDPGEREYLEEDVKRLIALVPNLRYRHILKRILLDDASYEDLSEELGTTLPNLYNLKKRAMAAFTAIAIREYGNGKN